MSKLKMNCGYCGRKCDLDKDFCIPQDSVYVCKSCYKWQNRVADLEAKLAEKEEQLNNSKQKCSIYHKDQENEQLEQELEMYKNEIVRLKRNWTNSNAQHKRHKNKLKEDNKALIKALELACYDMTRSLFPNKWQLMIPTMIEQYKEDAKEILKSE